MTSRLTDERIAEIEATLASYGFKDSLLTEVKALKAEKAQAEAERDVLIYFLNDARREEQARVESGDYSAMCPNTVLMTPNGDLDWLKYAKQQTEDVKDSTTK